MLAVQVLDVLEAIEAGGLRIWLDGGWGVDALLGTQDPSHPFRDQPSTTTWSPLMK